MSGVIGILKVPVFAQSKQLIELFKPDISAYPTISVNFRDFDPTGAFVKDLDISTVHILENGQVITPESLDMREPGVRLVVAVNEGPTLANRYAQVARIDKIETALTAWAQAQPITTMDDFSLVTNSGAVASHQVKPADWVQTIQGYQPDLRKATPGLTSLSTAIDLATDSTGSTEKTSAILYITPLPTKDQNPGLQDLISRAKIANVDLFIWLAGPQTYASDPQADLLIQAAEQTGGQFMVFSGMEALPDLSGYFDPLTYIYHAVYHSKIRSSGEFPLVVRINQGQSYLESDPLTFTLNAQPPNPIFLSPPASVERTWTVTKKKSDSVLTPNSFQLHIMIEFPDGMKRDLVYTRLFIDDKLVDENTAPPFTDFKWDISNLTESGTHTMSVSMEDSAGFIVQTLELPVDVIIQPKPKTWIEKIISSFTVQTMALFGVIALAGILLVLLAIRTLRINRRNKRSKVHRLEDPLTQPVIIENEIIHPKTKSTGVDQWPHIPGSGLAPARLLLQSGSGSGYPVEIPVNDHGLTFGNDAKKARIVLDSPTISPLHARIARDDQGQFKLIDEGSGSGTWLNYAPVSQYGAKLAHGDLVQFGTIAYRFEIYGTLPRKFKVETVKEEE
jgi:hypothetical protein